MGSRFDISQHAAQRWIERVQPDATLTEARAAIRGYSRAIEAAIELGCHSIRLACGARIVVKPSEAEVVTILPAQPKRAGHGRWNGRRPYFRASRGFLIKERDDVEE